MDVPIFVDFGDRWFVSVLNSLDFGDFRSRTNARDPAMAISPAAHLPSLELGRNSVT